MAQTVRKIALGAAVALLVLTVLPAPPAAMSADYPRRVAVAPFVNLTGQDEIKQVVAILPRLLSTRLMALAGTETLLLPPGEKAFAETAKEAKFPLLMEGTVSKLGKGYSIDTTVTDLSTGKPAGAFFASAATEDEIIPQVGVLAADVTEKLFGVKTARPQTAPAPAPAAASPPSQTAAAAPPVPAPGPGAAVSQTPAPTLPAAAPAPQPASPADGWSPSLIKKVSQSDKIADELFGVVAGDTDEAGNGEVIAYGATTIYVYRVKGNEIAPYTRVTRPRLHHFLNVDAVDLDGDGKKEILVTDLVGDRVESFVLKRTGDAYEEVAGDIRHYLVVLPDWMGKPAVVGQSPGTDTPFQGRFILLQWTGKGFKEGGKLPQNTDLLPLANGLLGVSSARFGKEWRLLYTDDESHLRLVDAAGKSEYKSRASYGMGIDTFEWGPYDRIEGRRKPYVLRKAPRPAGTGGDRLLILVSEVKKGLLNVTRGSYEATRLTLLQWAGGEFQEKAASQYSDYFISAADVLSPSGLRKGGRVIASSIEQFGSAFKDRVSRLSIFEVE